LNPDVSGLFLPPDLNLFTLRKDRNLFFPHQIPFKISLRVEFHLLSKKTKQNKTKKIKKKISKNREKKTLPPKKYDIT